MLKTKIMEDILFINRSSSRCGNCGRGASPDETTHEMVYEYTPTSDLGCGIRWTKVSSDYSGMEDVIKEIRPDLEWVNIYER